MAAAAYNRLNKVPAVIAITISSKNILDHNDMFITWVTTTVFPGVQKLTY